MNTEPRPIPLFSAQTANQGIDAAAVIHRVLDSHWYVLGKEVQAFEDAFARYIGVPHCVSLANGTDALELALRALGVQAGDTVATVANAGFYSSTAIRAIGAVPLYVDVDPHTRNMSADALQAALALRPKAVVVTHLYGRMADIASLCALAEQAGVPVVEDCAQAHGARSPQGMAGGFGALGCFSFYPTKNLGALGDGGAVVTRDARLDAQVRKLRQYGWEGKYHVTLSGGRNSRLDEMQAALLRAKLPLLDASNAQRRAIAQRYNAAFADLPVQCPDSLGEGYVAHLYVLATHRRDALRTWLAERRITSEIHYPVPDHQQAVMAGNAYPPLPVTERLAAEIVTLPCFPGLQDADVERVIEAVRSFFNQ